MPKHKMMVVNFTLVGLGGALGSVARYALAMLLPRLSMPYGTLAANAIGSLIIGVALANIAKENPSYLLAVVGFCGGFTTFSTFSAENIHMLRNGNFSSALLYIAISIIICLSATWLGTLIKFKQ